MKAFFFSTSPYRCSYYSSPVMARNKKHENQKFTPSSRRCSLLKLETLLPLFKSSKPVPKIREPPPGLSQLPFSGSGSLYHEKPGNDPPRITSNVKQNLQFLRLWKEFQKKNASTPKPATSYRRRKVRKEVLPEDEELYEDPTSTLYYTHQGLDTAVPVLLVDGYNVCGYWAELKKHFMKGRLDIARQKLIDELITFSVLKEVKVVVVFDAMMSGLPTHKENFAGIDVVFSGESCADAWIEKEVVALKEDGCPRVWVATSDSCQQQAAHGAGAFVWSCKALVSEIKASEREFERILDEHRSTSVQGKLLQHNLGPEVVSALKDLKKKLPEI